MKKSEWNDKQLEDLLKQLPKFTDDRHPHDIYQNISSHVRKRNRLTWAVPTIACVVALFLFFILAPGFLNKSEFSLDKNREDTSEKESFDADDETAVDFNMLDEEQTEKSSEKADKVPKDDQDINDEKDILAKEMVTAVYDDDLSDYDRLTFAIPDQMAQNIVPVTVLVEKDNNASWFEQFSQTAPLLTETDWALGEYYPLNGTLTFDQLTQTIHLNLPADHKYGQGSTGYTVFVRALEETFVSQQETVKSIKFTTENEQGFQGHDDYLEEISLKQFTNRAYYLYEPVQGRKPYIVPFTIVYEDMMEALTEMKKSIVEYELTPAIPQQVFIERLENIEGVLHLYLSNDTQFKNDEEAVYFIEAILLAAKDFGYSSVMFENAPIQEVGPFSLSEQIKVPIGANKRILSK